MHPAHVEIQLSTNNLGIVIIIKTSSRLFVKKIRQETDFNSNRYNVANTDGEFLLLWMITGKRGNRARSKKVEEKLKALGLTLPVPIKIPSGIEQPSLGQIIMKFTYAC